MPRIIQTAINDELEYLYRCDGVGFQPSVSKDCILFFKDQKEKFRKNFRDYSISEESYQDEILSRYQIDENMRHKYSADMPEFRDLSTYKCCNEHIDIFTLDLLIETVLDLNDLAENEYGKLELDYYFYDSGFLGRQLSLAQYLDNRCY